MTGSSEMTDLARRRHAGVVRGVVSAARAFVSRDGRIGTERVGADDAAARGDQEDLFVESDHERRDHVAAGAGQPDAAHSLSAARLAVEPLELRALPVAGIGHDFADGFNTYTVTSLYGNDRRRAITLLAADAVAPVAGAALTLAITIPHHILGLYLGFFAGFLMYLASADILPTAHTGHQTRLTLVCTIGGVLFMLAIIALAS